MPCGYIRYIIHNNCNNYWYLKPTRLDFVLVTEVGEASDLNCSKMKPVIRFVQADYARGLKSSGSGVKG